MKNVSKELAEQLSKVTLPFDEEAERRRILNVLFDGLNRKLAPIGLTIANARVGFDAKVDLSEIFAGLQAANLV
jgi:hypothetical protein